MGKRRPSHLDSPMDFVRRQRHWGTEKLEACGAWDWGGQGRGCKSPSSARPPPPDDSCLQTKLGTVFELPFSCLVMSAPRVAYSIR